MQEIALFLTGIAGVASAAAYKKFPKNRAQLSTIGASSHIQGKIDSLRIEKDILTKTISRLYQNDTMISKIQKDKLLSKYQHQLGIVLAKIEKLQEAGKHPDLGPIGDGLVTLMDQKLSSLDQRLYELSSKITAANIQIETKKEKIQEPKTIQPKDELPKPTQSKDELPKPKNFTIPDLPKRPKAPVELTTLTQISNKPLEFPLIKETKHEDKMDIMQSSMADFNSQKKSTDQLPPQLPKPISDLESNKKSPISEDDEDDGDDLDKIKGDIMRTLSNLEQAEVE